MNTGDSHSPVFLRREIPRFNTYVLPLQQSYVRTYVRISAVSSPTGEINRTLSESGGDAYVRILGGSSRVTLIGNIFLFN